MSDHFVSKTLLVGLVLLGLNGLVSSGMTGSLFAQDEIVSSTLEPRVNDFFGSLGELNRSRRAFDDLLTGGPLEESERLEEMVGEVAQLEKRFGSSRGHELVATQAIGADVYLLTWLAKTDQLPIVWRFGFYRRPETTEGSSRWVVISVRFDTDPRLLEDLGK